MDGLTNKQELFVQALIAGKSQREAYKGAFDTSRMKDKTVDEKASRLFANSKVRARYDEILGKVRGEAEKRSVATAVEVLEELSDIGLGRKEFPAYDMYGNEMRRKPTMTARLKALEMLGKNHALFTDKVQQNVSVHVPEMTMEEKMELIRKAAHDFEQGD